MSGVFAGNPARTVRRPSGPDSLRSSRPLLGASSPARRDRHEEHE
jgi:hypothetical protein